ncbi:MAG: DUF86 domain-containing protein [Patescibacteria group bacterium]
MNAAHVLENKISTVRKYLLGLNAFQTYSKEEILSDDMKLRALERQLYLLTQSTIDLAEAVLSKKRLRKPMTYKENFEVLSEAGLISKVLLEKMINMAGFRNILAHQYVALDNDKLYDVLVTSSKDIGLFLNELEDNL